MANHTIDIKLNTSADTAPLGKYTQALGNLSSEARGIGSVLSRTASKFGELGGALGNTLRGFLGGGIFGAAITGITAIYSHFKQVADDVAEASKKFTDESLAAMIARVNEYKSAVVESAKAAVQAANATLTARQSEIDLTERLTKANIELARQKRIAAGEDVAQVDTETSTALADASAKAAVGRVDAEIAAIRRRIEIAKDESEAAWNEAEFLRGARANTTTDYEDESARKQARAFRRAISDRIEESKAAGRAADERIQTEEAALEKALRKREAIETEIEASRLKAANERAQAEKKASDERAAAEQKASDEAKNAEIRAAQEAAKERDRLERELHQKRMADLRAEIAAQKEAAAPLQATVARAQSEFDRAFAMYRDPQRAAAEIQEERDYAADLKQLHQDARRYGGKWRIDELSQLMAAGDTQGVQSRLEDWRRSKSFTPEVESMVRASAAEQTKTTAEDELRKLNDKTAELQNKITELAQTRDGKLDGIEKNTSQLATKLDDLLKLKG